MKVFLFAACWLVCSILGYLLLKASYQRRFNGEWTRGIRLFCLFVALLGVPALATGILSMVITLAEEDDRPAKW